MSLQYRSVWISDTHLETNGSKAGQLRLLFDHVDCEMLYLVGDIIDLWKFRIGFYWSALIGWQEEGQVLLDREGAHTPAYAQAA